MATRTISSSFTRLAVLAALLVAAVALLGTASTASASESCGRIDVSVSKHRVKPGQTLRVSGMTCRIAGERPRFVRIKLRTKSGWRQIGISRTRATGRFTRRVRIRVPEEQLPSPATSSTRLRVEASDALSPGVPLEVSDEPEGSSTCPLTDPGYEVGETIQGCRVLNSDTASSASPTSFWGATECGTIANPERERAIRPTSGGDTHPTATGEAQGDDAYRRMTVFDGDDFWGERCELGKNDHEVGPTAFYREGYRRVTYVSLRLPDNFPLDAETWQTVLQMKQAQPSNNGGGVPILFMGAFEDTFFVDSENGVHWTFPAEKNVWTRFMFDVTYSQDEDRGRIQVAADIDGDGDFDDEGERSPRIEAPTLRAETAGPEDNFAPGASIPSHLRAGLYHDPSVPCPRPVGCSTEVDNVQVVAP